MKTEKEIVVKIKNIKSKLFDIESEMLEEKRHELHGLYERAKYDSLKLSKLILITEKDILEWVLFGVSKRC